MKALSIQQPWAWLIIRGYKDIENRSWPTRYRGPIWIHAGKKVDMVGYRYVKIHWPDIPLPEIHELDRGGLIGMAIITDCVTEHPSPWYARDQYGFVLESAIALQKLVPVRGLGLFDLYNHDIEPYPDEQTFLFEGEEV